MKYIKHFEELSPELLTKAKMSADDNGRSRQSNIFNRGVVKGIIGKELFNVLITSAYVGKAPYIQLGPKPASQKDTEQISVYGSGNTNTGNREWFVSEIYFYPSSDINDPKAFFKFQLCDKPLSEDGSKCISVYSNEIIMDRQSAIKIINYFNQISKSEKASVKKLDINPRKYFNISEDR